MFTLDKLINFILLPIYNYKWKKFIGEKMQKNVILLEIKNILSLLSIDQYNYSIILTLIILLKFYF